MEFKVDDTNDTVIKPLFETDSKLSAGLAIMDSFPLGMLGYLIAEERAKRRGILDVFHRKINELAEDLAQRNDQKHVN
jgi:uncharacterized membrane protein YgaE (UPF0421/DUF939 family)